MILIEFRVRIHMMAKHSVIRRVVFKNIQLRDGMTNMTFVFLGFRGKNASSVQQNSVQMSHVLYFDKACVMCALWQRCTDFDPLPPFNGRVVHASFNPAATKTAKHLFLNNSILSINTLLSTTL